MIHYTKGNLLDADVEAVVNTVNTVGVMGKGIALMFKERFPQNFSAYAAVCKDKKLAPGGIFVTERTDLLGPRWVINFATKGHWRHPSKMEWIDTGLADLRRFIREHGVKSIAVPPLGAGNGKLDWSEVKPRIEAALGDLTEVDVIVYEPTSQYQNVAKRSGVEKLTPARALIAELVRRYWILGIECSLLEIQKLAWFLERNIEIYALDDPLDLRFEANKYGPYARRLHHLINGLDGSYLHCHKRLADAGSLDVIWFEDSKKEYIKVYLDGPEAKPYRAAFHETTALIDGFETPLGLELLATTDWLIDREGCPATVEGILDGLKHWPGGGPEAGPRKLKLFDERLIRLALERRSQWDQGKFQTVR
ncbi:macro domain-containing protein [Candidatus Thiodictyon syntrophicum]|uniref:Appr-1-p processing protein n=1 Tax=Candidatus Thiodictyon syntrophicum TaxID=1166950 RepID=A0A2K8U6J2_9GAMM|nr:macro domain-containing protein [Candidatus Thiodictyon syntrophicum]AUB81210.1 Appr-1-p processing protein [Candidatus Thiodictyon syntrophicum]